MARERSTAARVKWAERIVRPTRRFAELSRKGRRSCGRGRWVEKDETETYIWARGGGAGGQTEAGDGGVGDARARCGEEMRVGRLPREIDSLLPSFLGLACPLPSPSPLSAPPRDCVNVNVSINQCVNQSINAITITLSHYHDHYAIIAS